MIVITEKYCRLLQVVFGSGTRSSSSGGIGSTTVGAAASTGSSDSDATDEEEEEEETDDRDGESGDEIAQLAQQLSEPQGALPISEQLQVTCPDIVVYQRV